MCTYLLLRLPYDCQRSLSKLHSTAQPGNEAGLHRWAVWCTLVIQTDKHKTNAQQKQHDCCHDNSQPHCKVHTAGSNGHSIAAKNKEGSSATKVLNFTCTSEGTYVCICWDTATQAGKAHAEIYSICGCV